MKYVIGVFVLNLPCSLETCGDWYTWGLRCENVRKVNSEDLLWDDYDKEKDVSIPEHKGKYFVANCIRVLLDLRYENLISLLAIK